jgi:hypothetical protein
MTFEPDDKVRQVAEAYAADAKDFARDHFGVTLDSSDESIECLETILDRFHRELPTAKPSEEKVFQFAKMFGSYIGEVFRNNHGATWGIVTLGDESFPGLRAQAAGTLFWPWGRVQNRLTNGAEDNVWHYYQALVGKTSGGVGPPETGVAKSSWWRRMWRGA